MARNGVKAWHGIAARVYSAAAGIAAYGIGVWRKAAAWREAYQQQARIDGISACSNVARSKLKHMVA